MFIAAIYELVQLTTKNFAFFGFIVMQKPGAPTSINVATKPLTVLNGIDVTNFLDLYFFVTGIYISIILVFD